MVGTKIRWTNETWNPTTGCHKVSEGCRYCYAEALSLRFGWSKKPWKAPYAEENVTLHPERLRKPYSWKIPSRVFVNSMSDLFHPLIPFDFTDEVFRVMADLPQHTFQILTKRPELMRQYLNDPELPGRIDVPEWPLRNIWVGTTVEDGRVANRIDDLRETTAVVRFLSCEPLIGPIPDIDLAGIHWVIVGGESGPHMTKEATRRPMDHQWARDIRDACVDHQVAYFFKQDSGFRTEERPWLVEEDGSHTPYEEYPNVDSIIAGGPAYPEATRRPVQEATASQETLFDGAGRASLRPVHR